MRCHLLVLLALSILLLVPASTLAQGGDESGNSPISLASVPWPPFSAKDGESRFAIDLVEEALAKAGFASQTQIVDHGTLTDALEEGRFDGSPAMWRSTEREEFLLYSKPFLENRLVLVGKKGAEVNVESLAELAGKRVAVVESYAYGESLHEGDGPQLVKGRDNQQNIQRLLAGEVDLMLVDELLIRHVTKHQAKEIAQRLTIGSRSLVTRTLHLTVRKDLENAKQIIAGFDQAIQSLVGAGTYNRVLGLDWIEADADGDGLPELITGAAMVGQEPPTLSYTLVNTEDQRRREKHAARYWVRGKVYNGWDEVPDELKFQDPDWNDPEDSTVVLFRFQF